MEDIENRVAFCLVDDDEAVGTFLAQQLPKAPGSYHYMPFRSAAHLQMVQDTAAGRLVKCYYENGSARTIVEVSHIPSPHVVTIVAVTQPANSR